jgi:8-oxo-dGTP pyrophosphatase MutT (NUDIX family)
MMGTKYLRRLAIYGVERGKSLIWPLRLGVRGIVIERHDGAAECILLVRHTYVSGWYLPGGGIEAGESAPTALARELVEETGVKVLASPVLHGFFFNPKASRRDYVVCYVVRDFRVGARVPDGEIAEAQFFPIDALPEGTSPATRARIAEIFFDIPMTEIW